MQGLDVKVWRDYEEFIAELTRAFPHEKAGIRKFYGECWRVFNALNTLELKSLEEPRYLLGGKRISYCTFATDRRPAMVLGCHACCRTSCRLAHASFCWPHVHA